jgi:multidrug efflux system outer membrane protein
MSKLLLPFRELRGSGREPAPSSHFGSQSRLTSTATVRGFKEQKFLGKFLVALFALALAGCTLAPKYQRPTAAISPAWPKVPGHRESQTKAAVVPTADIGWREFFRDSRLQQLIELALTNNLDLRVAMLNVEQTRALYRVQWNALIPTVDINANGTRQRIAYGFAGSGSGSTFNQFNVNLGVAQYELDLFGQVRSLKKQALETYFASEEARKSAQIALVAEVGAAYLTERELTEQLAVARQTLKAARSAYDLTKRSYEAGVLSELDLNVTETQMQTARAAVAGYEQQLAQEEDYLVLLVGRPLPDDLPPPQPFNPQICLSDIPAGLPSDLIERRPDILEAEHQLEAANANIGAARSAFFPTITLTGSAGSSSTMLDGLFAPGSQAWSFSPQLVWPIFAAGTAWAELQAVKAGKLIEVANYQKAIQTAFREVADSLAVRATVRTQLAANQATVKAERQNYELTQARFNSGVDSSLTVLAAQQNLDNARQNLIQSQYSRLFNLINLYQALGGGWTEHTVQE